MNKNSRGFTLIELLAVITIMGILMIVAIPAVTRIIENSRKDIFINTVKQYAEATKNMWNSDSLSCDGMVSSAVISGGYYVVVDSSDSSSLQLLESGGKSPWGNRDIKGVIFIGVRSLVDDNGEITRKVSYYPILVDGVHGVNISEDGSEALVKKSSERLVRGDLVMSNASYSSVETYMDGFTMIGDLNGDGDVEDVIDGVFEEFSSVVHCIEV